MPTSSDAGQITNSRSTTSAITDSQLSRAASALETGLLEVDLLQAVLHEMGHWIGVNHMTKGESIMAPSMEQARCIDFETVKAVAEQTLDSNGPDKLVGPQALTLHRKSTLK